MGVRVAAAAALAVAATAVLPGLARADRSFAVRYATNDAGDIVMGANTLLTCPAAESGCADAQAAKKGAALGNNSWSMAYVDVDGDASTFDSSRAQVVLPADATVLFAGLYWGANTSRGTKGAPAPDVNARNRALLATPAGGGYQAVTAKQVDNGEATSQQGAYQAFADVTGLVSAGGSGTYTVADVQTGTGVDRYAGWSLVVAYRSPSEPPRNLTVFDGFVTVNSGDAPRELSVSGFRTPATGPVNTRLGLVAYEGDLSLGGDRTALNGTLLKDQSGDANNFYNSTIGSLGRAVTTKEPSYTNQLGYDADIVDATGLLKNGDTSAAIKLETTGDTYLTGVVWLTTNLYAPDLRSSKQVADLNGGDVRPGDELQYTVTATNQGQDPADTVTVVDPVPAGTTFVPGSLTVAGAGRTDAFGDDEAQYDAGAAQVVFRVGDGASGTAGGRLVPGASSTASYRVRVDPNPSGTQIVNRARVSGLAETLAFPIQQATNETRLVTKAPDLAISKAFVGGGATGPFDFTLTVTNAGDATTTGAVTVIDPLNDAGSAGATSNPSGPGWTCDPLPAVRCQRSDPLGPGASYPPISVSVGLTPTGVLNGLVNTASVDGGGEINTANDSSTNAPAIAAISALSVDKQVTPDTAAPADQVTYLLTVRNNRVGAAATAVRLTDTVPAGLRVDSVEALDQGTCSGAVTCALGTLAQLATARVRIRATVTAQAGPGDVPNTAQVSGADPDPFPSDNTATATLHVRTTATLAMSKILDGQPVPPGSAAFTATIVNTGPHDYPGGTFADLTPDAVDNPVATVPGGSCTTSGRIASCSLPAIPAGGSVDVKVSGAVPASAAGEPLLNGIQAIPRAFSPDPPPGAGNQPGDVVGPAADVGVAKVGTPDPAPRGGEVTYHVRATNHGPTTATRVVVRDTLPAGVRFVRSSRCTASGRTVRCSVGTIRADRSVTFDITVGVPAGSTRALANTITIDAAQRDPASANNRDRASTPMAALLRLRKSATPSEPRVGATVRYTLRVSNPGTTTARNVVLCDRLGAGLALSRAPGSRRQGRARCWGLGTLRPWAAASRQLTATVTSGSRSARRNAASVSTSGTQVAAASTTVRVPGPTPPARFTG